MNKTNLNILKSICLILLLITYQYIPIIIFIGFGFSYTKLNSIYKIVYLFITSLLFMILLYYIYRNDIKKDIKYFKKNLFKILKISIKWWLIGLFIMILSNIIISYINSGNLPENEKSVREMLNKYPIYMLFQISIYAPFTEEIIFRKSIKDIFKNPYIYIIISGLVFGGMHVISSSFSNPSNLLFIIPYGALGSIFAYLYHKTDNIFASMSVHCIHNTITFLLLIISRSI